MKRIMLFWAMAVMACVILCVGNASAQGAPQVSKQAQKEAKRLKKEGWKSADLPIAEQLDKTWRMMRMETEDATPRYIYSTVEVVGNTMTAAQMEAENVCRDRIANSIQAAVTSEANMLLKNSQLSASDAKSFEDVMNQTHIYAAHNLRMTISTLQIFKVEKVRKNGEVKDNYTVRVTLMADTKKTLDMVKQEAMLELLQAFGGSAQEAEKLLNTVFDNARYSSSFRN